MGTGARSGRLGVLPEMPGQSLRRKMPRRLRPEWADSHACASLWHTINITPTNYSLYPRNYKLRLKFTNRGDIIYSKSVKSEPVFFKGFS